MWLRFVFLLREGKYLSSYPGSELISKSLMDIYLPPAFRKNVSVHTLGGGTPYPSHNTSIHWFHTLSGGGVPSAWSYVPSGRYSCPRQGVPQSGLDGGTPWPGPDDIPPPQARTGWVTPWARTVWGPPPRQNNRGGTCYHAGRLSCVFKNLQN